MSSLPIFFILFIATLLISRSYADDPNLIRQCASCICEAATECNAFRFTSCEHQGLKGEPCGPLQITRSYWVEAGSPTLRGDNPVQEDAFGNCVTDLHCAAQTMQQIMRKNAVDCNSDGMVNCDDYALMHYYGRVGCRGKNVRSMGEFGKKYLHCKLLINGLGPRV